MTTKPTPDPKPPASDRDTGSPLVPELPVDEHEEELIDEALTETFPASDPIAVPAPEDKRPRD
jgi:putative Mg2+ transporter-C (MgtC) family protein